MKKFSIKDKLSIYLAKNYAHTCEYIFHHSFSLKDLIINTKAKEKCDLKKVIKSKNICT